MRGNKIFLAVLLVTLSVLAACGRGGNNNGTAVNYSPKTTGSTWTYLATTNTQTNDTTQIITQSSSTAYSLKSGVSSYHLFDFELMSNGIWGQTKDTWYTGGTVQYTVTYTPPLPHEPSAWNIGTHDTGTITSTLNSSTGTQQTASDHFDMTVVGFESVTVPAGTFNALKVAYSYDGFTSDAWFVDGVGIVKSINSGLGYEWVLTSYTIL
jgi:hypothetical protein